MSMNPSELISRLAEQGNWLSVHNLIRRYYSDGGKIMSLCDRCKENCNDTKLYLMIDEQKVIK